jgi:CRP-like cAMP-binding protein
MITGIFNFLNQHTTVTEAEFQFLMTKTTIHNFNKKDKITEIAEIENRIYYIEKGLVRKFFYRDDEEVITQFVKEGSLISSTASFFSRKPSQYIIEAIEPTTAFSINYDELESIYGQGNKWEKIGRIITTHFLLQQEILMMDNIRLTVKERFKKFMNENPDLIQRVPQKQLASYLNIKQETFSRMKHLMYDKSLKTA